MVAEVFALLGGVENLVRPRSTVVLKPNAGHPAGFVLDQPPDLSGQFSGRAWFEPFVEFRFPRYGIVTYDGVMLELRQAIEPWHVLGEEVALGATSRYVDSSVERMQLKATGMTGGRHAVTCNGRLMPLTPPRAA